MEIELRLRLYLEDAWKFLEEAENELSRGLKEGDNIRLRDAAEKAWNAVVQASNALLLSSQGKVPSSHFERRKMLTMLEKVSAEAEQLGFRDRYAARERNLHELVFYDGIIDADELGTEFAKVRKYLQDVTNFIARGS